MLGLYRYFPFALLARLNCRLEMNIPSRNLCVYTPNSSKFKTSQHLGSWHAQDETSQCLLRLKQMISAGDHDTAAGQMERQLSHLKDTSASARLLKAQLLLERGHLFHSRAGVDGIQTDEKKNEYLEKA